ncbi:rhodanese-like domain-containing protein [Gelidibacter salicanalis]|uniref:Rhodanese-like domain-containing protein n=1 Tax=Gelidibacter salicanalis TaxID=291193 RepID=A0A934NE70_9FLAO|nr:rhodanese-like domain-containing protein [Gelidibacter salicanalis]MBJ7882405.1 rhodanese-like domain-containing protein [Gelidibacter salicanalis]
MADLTQDDWVSQMEKDADAVILDVRTQEEVSEGYIPGAINLDIHQGQDFIDELKKLDPDKSYYVYCRSGARSGQACSIMNQLGIAKAYNLEGGFMKWTGASTQ